MAIAEAIFTGQNAASSVPPTVAALTPTPPASGLLSLFQGPLYAVGDFSLFSFRAVSGIFSQHLKGRELLRVCVEIGVSSVGVVAITGVFIGMVLAVQAYSQFHFIGLDTSLGAVIHMSVVRELGPVLAAVMLAGRVGTAMAAQLGTMRVTEQIDALACLGVDPVKYLVGPRFLACILMIPLLAILADVMGILGSTVICLKVFHIDSYHYWRHTSGFVKPFDIMVGLLKATVFGGLLALICCHRGFGSKAGAEGVGRAATEGFVLSFVVILIVDFFMALFFNTLHDMLYPSVGVRVA